MKFQPWQVLAAPCVVLTAIFIALGYIKNDGSWAVWAAPPFIILAALYVMSPQVNWWWYKRNPPQLDSSLQRLFEDYFAYYQKLSPDLKERFRERVVLYMIANEFIRPVRPDDPDVATLRKQVPPNLKAAVAAHAVQVTFGKDDFTTGKFENIILYPHPFPTPQFQTIHTSEIFEEDGVLLFSADQLMAGFQNPKGFFSIGLYEMARVFKLLNPKMSYPNLDFSIWSAFEHISGMTKPFIESIIGLPNADLFGVAVHHFFTQPQRFQVELPDLYQMLSNIFNQNPVEDAHPILKY
jgi:Mlc titration factor MtfA (ptsG expression regulator)